MTKKINAPTAATTPQTWDFSVHADGCIRAWSVTGVQTCALPIFTLTLASAVTDGQVVTVQYTSNATAGNKIKDRDSLDTLASDGSAQSVSNTDRKSVV